MKAIPKVRRKGSTIAAGIGLVLLALAGAVPSPRAATAEGVAWSTDRPLRWSDFAGSVERGTADENVAATVASLNWTYAYEFERAGERCRYRITAIRAFATFHPDQSWVKPDHTTASVLAHEQGHFDVTQVHKLMFEAATRDLVGAGGACEGRTDNRISRFIQDAANRRIGPIYDDVWSNHLRIQALYDLETGHGTRAAPQQAWLARIAAALDGRGWTALGVDAAP
jgi:hypothetical protein